MNETELYAKIGRMQVLLETQDAAYTQLLGVLAGVVGGDIHPSRVLVNLTNRGWTLAPDGFSPEIPATVNGLPKCVVWPGPDVVPEIKNRPEPEAGPVPESP